MRASHRRTRTNPLRSIASAVQPAQSHRRLLDCRACGAPNADRREACFNCGALLQVSNELPRPPRELLGRCSGCGSLLPVSQDAVTPLTERLELGADSLPGRVLYVDLQPRDGSDS